MAMMGVHINQGGGGGIDTSLGDTLAKAIFGDPELEMKLALQRQEYDTEDWKRRLYDAQIAHEQAQTAEQTYKTTSRQEATPAIQEYQAGLVPKPMPVPVDAVPIPVPTPRDVVPAPVDLNDPMQAAAQLGAAIGGGGTAMPVPVDPNAAIMPAATGATEAQLGHPLPPQRPQVLPGPQPDIPVTPEQQAAYEREIAARKAQVLAIMGQGGNAAELATGIGRSEGIIKGESSDPNVRTQGNILYTGNYPPVGAAGAGGFNEAEQKLRKEYFDRTEVQKFAIINSRYQSMLNNAKIGGGVGDTGMIYDAIKILDPTSSVMGGEQVTAQNAPGMPASWISYFNGLLNMKGDKFDSAGRQAFIQMAKGYYDIGAQAKQGIDDYYTRIAIQNQLKPENIIYPTSEDPAIAANKLPPGITEDMVQQALRSNPQYNGDRNKAIKLLIDRLVQPNAAAGGQ